MLTFMEVAVKTIGKKRSGHKTAMSVYPVMLWGKFFVHAHTLTALNVARAVQNS